MTTLASADRTWAATCCSGTLIIGGDAGPGSTIFDCAGFCPLATQPCSASVPPLYTSDAACQTACAPFDSFGLALGTGDTLRFPHPRITQALAAARIGVEVMDLQAACRTYNILMAEERKVAAALLFS